MSCQPHRPVCFSRKAWRAMAEPRPTSPSDRWLTQCIGWNWILFSYYGRRWVSWRCRGVTRWMSGPLNGQLLWCSWWCWSLLVQPSYIANQATQSVPNIQKLGVICFTFYYGKYSHVVFDRNYVQLLGDSANTGPNQVSGVLFEKNDVWRRSKKTVSTSTVRC
jgi:hypothetical protein